MELKIILLGAGAFIAGLIDAVVGGGGLVLIPLLLSAYPNVATPVLFGTNKIASIVGTSSAAWRYSRKVVIPWRLIAPASVAALVGAWFGARVVSLLPPATMKPLVLFMLIAVGIYTFWKKDFGRQLGQPVRADKAALIAILVGTVIGFYDGFFGPGTGSFLIFAFVRLFGMDMLNASANAKIINVATNFAALAYFILFEGILWKLAFLMAICNLCGAQVGAHLAIKHGNGFVRKLFLVMVVLLVSKLGWDLLMK